MICKWRLVIVLMLVAASLAAQGLTEEQLKLILDASDKERERQLTVLEKDARQAASQFERVKKAGINPRVRSLTIPKDEKQRVYAPSAAARTAAIKDHQSRIETLQQQIANLKDGKGLPLPKLQFQLKVGMAGEFPISKVQQVLGKREMLLETTFSVPFATAVGNTPVTRFNDFDVVVLMRGVDTSGLADDATYRPEGRFLVSGTESFNDALGGKRTLMVIEPLDLEAITKAKAARVPRK